MIFEFHQSWLGDYLLCPERARHNWFKLVPDGPSDATAIGTGVHAAAEALLGGSTEEAARAAAYAAFEIETQDPHFQWKQVKTIKTALRYIDQCWDNWLDGVYPHLGQAMWIEQPFDLPLTEWGGHEIRLAGTVDFADEGSLWDWKTGKDDLKKYEGGRFGEGWKLKRFGIQPIVYCWAARQLGELPDPNTFLYGAVSKNGHLSRTLEVTRSADDDEWLKQLCINAVKMLVSGLDEWPKNDQHALCSAQWCPVWAAGRCKGSPTQHDAAVSVR